MKWVQKVNFPEPLYSEAPINTDNRFSSRTSVEWSHKTTPALKPHPCIREKLWEVGQKAIKKFLYCSNWSKMRDYLNCFQILSGPAGWRLEMETKQKAAGEDEKEMRIIKNNKLTHPDFIFLSGTRYWERGQPETRTNHFNNRVDVDWAERLKTTATITGQWVGLEKIFFYSV